MSNKTDYGQISQYLNEQARYKDSPLSKFFNYFSLSFVLKNLNTDQREKFLSLLEKEKFQELFSFLVKNLPNLGQELPKALKKEAEKINRSIEKHGEINTDNEQKIRKAHNNG